MERSFISNKRSHDTMIISPGDDGDDDDNDDGCCCSHTKRFKTKNANESWNKNQEAADVQLLLLSKRNKRNAKAEELGEEETSRRKALLEASIHKDICRVQEMMADMNKTTGSQRNELMMSIRKDIHLMKQKLDNLEKVVPPGRELEADAHVEFQAFQQVLGKMTIVNVSEERPISQPIEKVRNEKKKDEETAVSSRGTTMTASNLTPLRKKGTSQRRASDYFVGKCPRKATLQIAMDLEIPQIKAASNQSVPPRKVGLATSKSRVTLERSRANARRKATAGPDLFTRRERRFKAMREALSEVSMYKKSKTQFATIWMELDDTWRKMMAYESFKSFEKRKGKAVSDYPMKAIDAHLDELESWISAL